MKEPGAVIDRDELDPGIEHNHQEENIDSPPGQEAKHHGRL